MRLLLPLTVLLLAGARADPAAPDASGTPADGVEATPPPGPSPSPTEATDPAGAPRPDGGEPAPPAAEDVAPPPRAVVAPDDRTPDARRAPGTTLPEAPSAAPGRVPPHPRDPLAIGRERYAEGDLNGTVAALTPWLSSRRAPWGRARTAGHLLLGMAHYDLQNWNLASRHFYRVRRQDNHLSSFGAWYEALVDHRRGRHTVAVRECNQYREKWPGGPHADECLLLIGDAWAAHGNRGASVAAFNRYLEQHPDSPRREEIALATALAAARKDPARGIAALHELALDHSYPSTDLAVQAELAALRDAGQEGTALPDDPRSKMRRAWSLRRSGKFEAAWELFNELAALAAEDEVVQRWVQDNEDRFAWSTRNYDVYAGALAKDYAERSDPDIAWRIFVAWSRAGEWAKAAEWGRKGLDAHASHWRWRSAKDDMAWATMLAGEYEDAAERWGALAKRGGDFGRKAKFYHGFSLHRANRHEEAVEALGRLVDRKSAYNAPAHYWRSKALAALGKAEDAHNEAQLARVKDRDGWYVLLLDNQRMAGASVELPDPATLEPTHTFHGRWAGDPAPAPFDGARPERRTVAHTRLWPAAQAVLDTNATTEAALLTRPRTTPSGFSALTWDVVQASSGAPAPAPVLEPADALTTTGIELPEAYMACRWYDRDAAAKDFLRFTEAHKGIWPRLPAAYDLAMAGLYTDAARVLFGIYEEWRQAVQSPASTDPRDVQIRALNLTLSQWRPFLLLVRDHYHAARACWGLEKHANDEEERIAALRLGYPLVRPELVWQWARRFDVDPYLVYGIMRQESTYRNTALSPVGAIGLIQVMPSTGARVAALLGEHRYSPGDLEEPAINLRYGIFYLSRLLDRFDGNFPLAVASYNGGPHNVSRWYRPWSTGTAGSAIPLDAFVETIQYDETRDYVKRVSGHYARYVEIYEGSGASLLLPERPTLDDATVIDF